MPSPAVSLGPILEVMTWVGIVPGLLLLITGWVISKRRCRWTSTDSEIFTAGRYRGVRWSDSTSTIQQGLLRLEQSPGLVAGQVVVLHYDICHPTRWRLDPPRQDDPVTVLGLLLTGVGIACMIAGFVLLMF